MARLPEEDAALHPSMIMRALGALRRRRCEVLALVAVTLCVASPACSERPRIRGDAAEYMLVAESLVDHGHPSVRATDFRLLAEWVRTERVEGSFGRVLGLFAADREGRVRGIHSWTYPLLTAPVKLVQRALGANDLKASQVTNGLLFLGALAHILCGSRSPAESRWRRALLHVASPALPFILWPHPEVYSYALATSALVLRRDGHPAGAVLLMAFASHQNPPLILAAAVFALEALVTAPREAGLRPWLAPAALLVALIPPALHLLQFGTANLLGRVGAVTVTELSLRKALELFLEPNLGMLPYVPLTLLLAAAGSAIRLRRGPGRSVIVEAWLLLVLMAYACTATTNWNHGTSGPSRYAIWLLPFVFDLVVRLAEGWSSPRSRAFAGLVLAAGLIQAAIAAGRGLLDAPTDNLRFSPVARFLLERWPPVYVPDHEVFTERVTGSNEPPPGPYVYRDDAGRCRKALVQKRHLPELQARCGAPRGATDFRRLIARESRDAWAYLDY